MGYSFLLNIARFCGQTTQQSPFTKRIFAHEWEQSDWTTSTLIFLFHSCGHSVTGWRIHNAAEASTSPSAHLACRCSCMAAATSCRRLSRPLGASRPRSVASMAECFGRNFPGGSPNTLCVNGWIAGLRPCGISYKPGHHTRHKNRSGPHRTEM